MSTLFFIALVLFVILCVLLCGTILIQETKSSGLGASFGGDASDSVFGTSTADVLKQFTGYLGVAFLIACVVLSYWTAALGRSQAIAPATLIESGEVP